VPCWYQLLVPEKSLVSVWCRGVSARRPRCWLIGFCWHLHRRSTHSTHGCNGVLTTNTTHRLAVNFQSSSLQRGVMRFWLALAFNLQSPSAKREENRNPHPITPGMAAHSSGPTADTSADIQLQPCQSSTVGTLGGSPAARRHTQIRDYKTDPRTFA